MRLWVFALLTTSCASAHHSEFHIPEVYTVHSAPQQTVAYAIPVQIVSAPPAAALAEEYPAAPAIFSAPSPQIYTATVAPAPQVYAAVTPAPQYAVQSVEVQHFPAPKHSVQTYSQPSYSAISHSPQSFTLSNQAQTFSSPSYVSKSSSATSQITHPNKYSSPATSVSSQITHLKTYSPSYSSQTSVKIFPETQKPVYTSPAKILNSPQYSAVQFKTPAVQYKAPAVQYKAPAVQYKAPAVQYKAPAVQYKAPAVQYKAPAVQYKAPAVQYKAPVVQYHPPDVQYSSSAYVKPVAILRQSQDDSFDGSFSYDFQTENGIAASATGHVRHLSPEAQAQVIQGQYSYTAPDGTPVVTRWYADETGFHAEGSHLPVAPPVPPAIAKSLAYHGVA